MTNREVKHHIIWLGGLPKDINKQLLSDILFITKESVTHEQFDRIVGSVSNDILRVLEEEECLE